MIANILPQQQRVFVLLLNGLPTIFTPVRNDGLFYCVNTALVKTYNCTKRIKKLSPEEKKSPKFNKNPLWISVLQRTTERKISLSCNVIYYKLKTYIITTKIKPQVRFPTGCPINKTKPYSFCNMRNINELQQPEKHWKSIFFHFISRRRTKPSFVTRWKRTNLYF